MKKLTLITISLLLTATTIPSLAQKHITKDTYKISPTDKYRYIWLVPRDEIGSLGNDCSSFSGSIPGSHTLYINSDNENAVMACQNVSGAPVWSYLPDLWQLHIDHTNNLSIITLPDFNQSSRYPDWATTTRLGIGTDVPEFTLSITKDGGILAKGTELTGTVDPTDNIPDFYDIFINRHNGRALNPPTGYPIGLPIFWWYSQKGAFRAQYMRDTDISGDYTYYDLWGQTAGEGYPDDFDPNLDGNIGYYSTALGDSNIAAGRTSFVVGYRNKAFNHLSSIIGGSFNTIQSNLQDPNNSDLLNTRFGSTIVGGMNNSISGPHNLITGGQENVIDGNSCAIAGGAKNTIQNYASLSASAHDNALFPADILDETHSIILGGRQNENYGRRCAIVGGITAPDTIANNVIKDSATYSAIFQGIENIIFGTTSVEHSVIAGGNHIALGVSFSTILSTAGDNLNPVQINHDYSFFLRPHGNFPDQNSYNVVLGGVNSFSGNYSVVLSSVATANNSFTPVMDDSNYSIIHGGGDYSRISESDYAVTINKGGSAELITADHSFATEGQANKQFSVIHGGTSSAEYSYTMLQFPECPSDASNTNFADRSFFFGICPDNDLGPSSGTMTDRFIIYGSYDHDGSSITPNLEMRVGIGVTAPDERLHVNGTIQATSLMITDATLAAGITTIHTNDTGPYSFTKTNDIAEIFPTHEQVEPGDIVAIDPGNPEKLRKSQTVYDHTVLGVASYMPAVTLEGHQMVLSSQHPAEKTDHPSIALAGRVMIKVSLENGPIHKGDLLTSSSIPGVAMRADRTPQARHAIVAKALENFLHSGEDTGMITGLMMIR